MLRTFRDDRRCARKENKNGPRKRGNRALRKRRPPNQLKTRRLSMKTGLHARLVRLSPGQQAMRAMLSSIVVSVSSRQWRGQDVRCPRSNSSGLSSPSPPAEKATASQDQAGKASVSDPVNAQLTRLPCLKQKRADGGTPARLLSSSSMLRWSARPQTTS